MQAHLGRRVDDEPAGDDRVEKAVRLELAGRCHEQGVAGLGQREVEQAASDIAAHLEDPAPEESHEESLDQHRGPDKEEHLVLGPTRHGRGVAVDHDDHDDVYRDPEELNQAPDEEVAAKHRGARERIARAREPYSQIMQKRAHGRAFSPPPRCGASGLAARRPRPGRPGERPKRPGSPGPAPRSRSPGVPSGPPRGSRPGKRRAGSGPR